MLWLAVAGLAISIVTGIGVQHLAGRSANIRGDLLKLAKDVAHKISSNNALKEKFLSAYQERNNRKLTSLMYGIGFGPRAASLEKEISADKDNMLKVIDEINQENIKLEKVSNGVNGAISNAGTLTGNADASKTLKDAKAEFEDINNSSDLQQNINGGTI